MKTMRDNAGMRWLVLILISGLMFATYWFQDFYGGLKGMMTGPGGGFTSEEFGRIIGLTTIANMFGMIIIGGIFLDKWGIRLAGLVFGGLAVLGALVSAFATAGYFGDDHSSMLTWMIIGRVMFGSGLEIVCVIVTKTVVKWFKGYTLATAMAINVGFGRLGSATGIAISPDIAGNAISPAVSFAATLIGIGLIMFIIYIAFDIKLDKQLAKLKKNTGESGGDEDFKFSDLIKLGKNPTFMYIALLCVAFYAAVFPFIQYAADIMVNKFGFTYVLPEAGQIIVFGSAAIGSALVYVTLFIFGISFSLVPAQIKKMGGKLISIAVILALFILFISSISEYLGIWFKNGPKTASLIPLGTILFTPIFGGFVDRKGKAASLMMLGSALLILAHLTLSLSNSVALAYGGLLMLGIAFSLVPAAMWPSVAKIVPEHRLGTAYASMFTVQNWGLGLFFWGIGALLDFVNKSDLDAIAAGDKMYDYTIPIFVLVGCGVISIFLSYKLKRADKKQGYGLELPSGATAEPVSE